MALLETPICRFGWQAVHFMLLGTDGNMHTLNRHRGDKGTVVMFICNHCPYVQAVIGRIVADMTRLREHGIGALAIMPNDVRLSPDDSFDGMVAFARAHALPFPYLIDSAQRVAWEYGALCTPDFFGFNRNFELQYRGRLDSAGKGPAQEGSERELVEAMIAVSRTGQGPRTQHPSMGCSIKWGADSDYSREDGNFPETSASARTESTPS